MGLLASRTSFANTANSLSVTSYTVPLKNQTQDRGRIGHETSCIMICLLSKQNTMIQQEKARMLHLAHQQDTLVLPNAWDAASASIIENAGAKVIGSSSAAVAWSCGLSDGQVISRQRMLQTLREIVSATTCPVSADIESGYGSGSTEDVRKTVFCHAKSRHRRHQHRRYAREE